MRHKKYIQHIESIEKRIQCVIDFVQKVAQDIELSVVPILEPLGPTGTIHDIEALVISEETASGAAYGMFFDQAHSDIGPEIPQSQ